MRNLNLDKPTDWQKVRDRLPLATDRELVMLRVAIDRILLDPQRTAAIRSRLVVGQSVQYLSERQNRINDGRVVELMADRVLIETQDQMLRWLHYASIQIDAPAPPRAAFNAGDTVSFDDRELIHRFGVVKRVNRLTVTVTSEGRDLRIPYAQLRRVVDL